jgi:hypothetical protein
MYAKTTNARDLWDLGLPGSWTLKFSGKAFSWKATGNDPGWHRWHRCGHRRGVAFALSARGSFPALLSPAFRAFASKFSPRGSGPATVLRTVCPRCSDAVPDRVGSGEGQGLYPPCTRGTVGRPPARPVGGSTTGALVQRTVASLSGALPRPGYGYSGIYTGYPARAAPEYLVLSPGYIGRLSHG